VTALIRCNGCGYLMYPDSTEPALKIETPTDALRMAGQAEFDWDLCIGCANTVVRLVSVMHRAKVEDDVTATGASQALEDIERLLAAVVDTE
jgi:hypothetical protein